MEDRVTTLAAEKPAFSILLKPIASNAEILQFWQNYRELKAKLLDPVEDFCEVQGKRYPKKSAYRKLALAFGISVEIITERRLELANGVVAYEVTAKAISPNGRNMTALGSCHSNEKKFGKPSDVRAIANTRSCNRAISDLLADLGTSAEEIISEPVESYQSLGEEPAKSKSNNSGLVFGNLINNRKKYEEGPEEESTATDRQLALINKLLDQKPLSDSERAAFYETFEQSLTKSQASDIIRELLGNN